MWKAAAAAALVVEICLAGKVFAESATKDECVAKCKDAAQLVTDKGIDAAIAEINKKDGPFVWKDSYVFMMDLEGKMLVLQHHIRQLSMAQVVIFQELKSFLRISIRAWLMDQNPCERSHFLAIGVLTQRCSTSTPDQAGSHRQEPARDPGQRP